MIPHRRGAACVLVGLLVAGCLTGPPESPPPIDTSTEPGSFHVDVVAGKLETVWALDFAPDGRIFLTERAGRVRIIDADGQLRPDPWLDVGAAERGESGLMGLALHPTFPSPAHVYLYYTYQNAAGLRYNKVVRYTDVDGHGTDPVVLQDFIPAADIHDGGRVRFGPDGRLYVTTGDAAQRTNSQDPSSLAGKLLRFNVDGTIPSDNPRPLSPMYTLGHRNSQGICWQPGTGRLYSTEHGPESDDELNLIEKGKNYGWPTHGGTDSAPGFEPSLTAWTPTIAPAGCAFYQDRDGRFPAWDGNLFFVTLKEKDLRRIEIDSKDPRRVVGEEVLLDGEFGRLRDVVQGPDGFLYLTTSNQDGRGGSAPPADTVLRIVFD